MTYPARLLTGDALTILRTLPEASVRCCVTSPPYWGLRDYGMAGQLGLEKSPQEYVERMVEVFREVRRVLTDDGTLWLNLGDSYVSAPGPQVPDSKTSHTAVRRPGNPDKNGGASNRDGLRFDGLAPKNLVGIPWRVAFALQADGWYLRSDIIWAKPNPMPESVTDRPTKSHETVFLLAKSATYYYDAPAIAEPGVTAANEHYPARARVTGRGEQASSAVRGNDRDKSGGFPPRKTDKQRGHSRRHAGFNDRWDAMSREEQTGYMRNSRSVWTIPTQSYQGAHFATFPDELASRCIRAGSAPGDLVIDPFSGSGTTAAIAVGLGRRAIGIELNPVYQELARQRIGPMLCEVIPAVTDQEVR